MLTTLAAGRTLTVLDGLAVTQDAYNNDVAAWPETTVEGCTWWPSSTSEARVGGDTDQITSRLGVLFPDGTTINGVDRVRLDDGTVWEIDGDPRQHVSTITGVTGGIYAWLQRVTG